MAASRRLPAVGARVGWVAAAVAAAVALAWGLTGPGVAARDEKQPAEAAALPADLAAVPRDAFVLVSIRLADAVNSDIVKQMRRVEPKEIARAGEEFRKNIGVLPEQVERLTVVSLFIRGPEEPLFFVQTVKPYDRDKLIASLPGAEKTKSGGKVYYANDRGRAIYPISDRAFLVGKAEPVRQYLTGAVAGTGPLLPALTLAAKKHLVVVGVNPEPIAKAVGDNVPPQAEPFKPLLRAKTAVAAFDIGDEVRADLRVTFPNEADAKKGEKSLQAAQQLALGGVAGLIKETEGKEDLKSLVGVLREFEKGLKTASLKQDGAVVEASGRVKIDRANAGAILLESVKKTRQAAARAQDANNLKQIAIAMHNYHDTYGRFPPAATYSKDGKPLLSWRVLLLPFVEQDELYKQFKLDEPWDSPNNKKLLAKMPKVYMMPTDEKAIAAHKTFYQVFHGKGTIFEGKNGIRITDITDGTSNTILVAEAATAVPWSKPEDLPFNLDKPLPKLGGQFQGGWNAALADGSVRFISNKITVQTLKSAITRNGGEVLGNDW